jgi:hypothetical protein
MKTMMKKTTQYWGVSTKFFDSGKVKANIFPVVQNVNLHLS